MAKRALQKQIGLQSREGVAGPKHKQNILLVLFGQAAQMGVGKVDTWARAPMSE